MLNIIFMGTPDFAVPSLEKIHKNYGIQAVVTAPDKPKGRGRKLSGSPVKEKAVELDIPILQPEKLKDYNFIDQLNSYQPDIICVIAFRILPESVFNIPKIAAFNIHGSLLPKYRGASPINSAIMNGDSKTGLTSFILQKKVDTGNIILTKEIDISDDMTAGELHYSLMPMAANLSCETIDLLFCGEYEAKNQDDSLASQAPKIFREDCKINFYKTASEVHNHIRGLSPYPAAWTLFNDKEIKILRSSKLDSSELKPGEYKINSKFSFGTKKGDIQILELKPQGKGNQKVDDFLRGYRGEKSGIFS